MSLKPNSPGRIGFFCAVQTEISFWGISRALKWMGLRKLVNRMNRRFPAPFPLPMDRARHLTALKISSRLLGFNRRVRIFPASCLVESLALWRALRRRRIPADLKIGVRTLTGNFESHAWVELQGMVLNDIEQVGMIYSTVDLGRPAAKGRRK